TCSPESAPTPPRSRPARSASSPVSDRSGGFADPSKHVDFSTPTGPAEPADRPTWGSAMEWSLPAVHDVIAAAVPDRTMIVCEGTRRTYQEVADRTRGLAAFLVERGITVHRARGDLERWE